jgi:precorrin-3B synthase
MGSRGLVACGPMRPAASVAPPAGGSTPSTPPHRSACPSVAEALPRTDGGLVRLRVPGGRIDAAGLAAVAEAASRFASGEVEITNRANLQLRGVRPGSEAALAEALSAAGLSAGRAGDRRRNVLLGPLGGLEEGAEDLGPLLAPLLAALDAEPRLDGLDDKFGFALDGGGSFTLAGRRAAVVALPAGDPGWMRLCWGWARDGEEGSVARPRQVAREQLVEALVGAALDSLGRERAAVAVPPCGPTGPRPAGPLGIGDGWVGAMPVLGRTDAAGLEAIARAAERFSGGLLRLTAWRGVVLPAPAPGDRPPLLTALAESGLVVDPADPASTVVACVGARGCSSGLTDAAGDARLVIAARRAGGRPPAPLHVSGCARCCADRYSIAPSLVGSAPGYYELHQDGAPIAAAIPSAEAVELAAGM